jgi:hypothetical protein
LFIQFSSFYCFLLFMFNFLINMFVCCWCDCVFLKGYRTLVVCEKTIDPKVYKKWNNKMKKAQASLEDRDTLVWIFPCFFLYFHNNIFFFFVFDCILFYCLFFPRK